MPYQRYLTASLGSSKVGLSSVGYTLFNQAGTMVGNRVSQNIQPLGGGAYGAYVQFPDNFQGRITWDTGESIPKFASEEINDARIDLTQSIPAENVSSKTTQNVGDCLSTSRADSAGKMVLNVTNKTQTLYGPNGEVVRVFTTDDPDRPTRRD